MSGRGYHVNAAPDVESAKWMCENGRPDLVVTDYELGDSDGLALADWLVRRFGERAPPVILISGSTVLPRARDGIAATCSKIGADGELVGHVMRLVGVPVREG